MSIGNNLHEAPPHTILDRKFGYDARDPEPRQTKHSTHTLI